MEILRKLSSKFFVDQKQTGGTFYGRAVDYQGVTSPFGTATKFIGDFRAMVNGEDAARSAALYLPAAAENALRAAVDEARAGFDGGHKVAVDFAFELSQRPNAKSNTGYEWVTNPVFTEESETDPVRAIRARMTAARTMRPGVVQLVDDPPKGKGGK